MATQTFKFKGKVKWCRPDQPNEWGKFATRFYPVEEDKLKMKQFQIKNEWKDDLDGEFINISCQKEREFRGQKIIEHIEVLDKEGKPWMERGFIGDGSDVILTVDYYDHPIKGSNRRGHALKWRGVQIENLTPYIPASLPTETPAVH